MATGRAVAVRAACVLCALAALLLAVVAGNDLYFTGFPDSHYTDYDTAAETPKRVLMWVEWGFVVGFLLLAIPRLSGKARSVGLLTGVVALVLVVIIQWVGIPWREGPHCRDPGGR